MTGLLLGNNLVAVGRVLWNLKAGMDVVVERIIY
jgi:hypothetical protein